MAQENKDNKDIEIKHYSQIIEYFEVETDPKEIELWKYKTLITLMDDLKQAKYTQEMIKNSLILMQALTNDSCDEYTSRGTHAAELSDHDKETCRAHLKKELLIQ
jgi:hypothetical protein